MIEEVNFKPQVINTGLFQTMSKNLCDVYPLIATMPRRTHTHYISNVPDNTKYLTTDVTLVTQLMINRIDNLERLLDAWKGPSQVALYLTDEELITFKDFYDHSSILKRANATYHVIFKRHVSYLLLAHVLWYFNSSFLIIP